VRRYTYDAYGRLRTSTSGRGVTTTFDYDDLDHLIAQSYSDGTPSVRFDYDTAGNQVRRTDSTGTTTLGYDPANKLTDRSTDDGNPTTDDSRLTQHYSYDQAERMVSFTDARGTISYRYTVLSWLDRVDYPDGSRSLFDYNSDGKRTDTWHGVSGNNADGMQYTADHHMLAPSGFALHLHSDLDNDNRLIGLRGTRASSDADSNRVSDLTYDYKDVSGKDTNRRQRVTDKLTGRTTRYDYRSARLTDATGGGTDYHYSYDSRGNLTTGIPGADGGTLSFNSANQLTNSGYRYDGTGNLTASPQLGTLEYNGSDQTTRITLPSTGLTDDNVVDFGYAGTDQNERTSVRTSVPSAAGPVNTTGRSFANGPLGVQAFTSTGAAGSGVTAGQAGTVTGNVDRDPTGGLLSLQLVTQATSSTGSPTTNAERLYYYFDGLGSVLGLIDSSGSERAHYGYDAFGNPLPGSDGIRGDRAGINPYRYAGGYTDPKTGLVKFGLRYYQPTLGRWTQQDSIERYTNLSQGNRYAYVADDPLNNTDPTGQDACSVGAVLTTVGLAGLIFVGTGGLGGVALLTGGEAVLATLAGTSLTGGLTVVCENSSGNGF